MSGPHDLPEQPAQNPPGAQYPGAPAGPPYGSAIPPFQQVAPPPVAPPPPQYVQAPRQRGAFGHGFGLGTGAGLGLGLAMVVMGVVGSIISGLLMLGFAGAIASRGGTGPETQQTIWGAATAKKKIQAIEITGTILNDASDGSALVSGTYGYEIAGRLDALKAEDADAVILLMNTPGGTVPGSRAMGEAVERYQQRTGKKLFAYVKGMSASGGMFTMAGADEIVADHGSLVGSVGVISGPFLQYNDPVAISGSLLESGVTTRGGITGGYMSAGKGKDFGSPWRPMTDEERSSWQALLDNEYAEFAGWVSRHRGIPESTIRDELGASLFDTKRAQEVRYIDAVMTREDAFRHFAQVAGLDPDDTRVVAPTAPDLVARLLGAEARVLGHAPAAQPVGGQPARATASFCTSVVPMAYHGSLAAACG